MGASASCVHGGRTSAPSSSARARQPTASAVVAVTSSGHHLFKIDNYSRAKDMFPTPQYIKSLSFRVGGHSWHISYYPNGVCPEDEGYVSVFLVLDGDAVDPVKAQYEFSFVDDTSSQKPSFIRANGPVRSFCSLRNAWGCKRFILKEDLQRSTHLVDDCFTIRCDVVVISGLRAEETEIAGAATPAPKTFVAVPPADLQHHFGDLLSSKLGADVEFRVGSKTFAAHRYVLAARSPVFKAELFGGTREKFIATGANVIHIADMEARVFEVLLHFIYTDSLPETKKQEQHVLAQHLLVAADIYDLQRLKLICEDKLCEYIDINTVASILAFAEQRHCDGLKHACFEFLNTPANLKAVMATTDGFEILGCPSVVKEIIEKLAPP